MEVLNILDGESNPMATDQGFCALVAYQRYQDKENSFFDMTRPQIRMEEENAAEDKRTPGSAGADH